jgi:hypothetical protein
MILLLYYRFCGIPACDTNFYKFNFGKTHKIKFISSAGYEPCRRPQGRVPLLPYENPIGFVPAASGGELRLNYLLNELTEIKKKHSHVIYIKNVCNSVTQSLGDVSS